MDREGLITLTDKGMEIAARIYERHKVLTALLIGLGVASVIPITAAAYLHNVSTLCIAARNATPLLDRPRLERGRAA